MRTTLSVAILILLRLGNSLPTSDDQFNHGNLQFKSADDTEAYGASQSYDEEYPIDTLSETQSNPFTVSFCKHGYRKLGSNFSRSLYHVQPPTNSEPMTYLHPNGLRSKIQNSGKIGIMVVRISSFRPVVMTRNVLFTMSRETIWSIFVRCMIIGSVAPGLIPTTLDIIARWILFQPTMASGSRDCRGLSKEFLEVLGNVGVETGLDLWFWFLLSGSYQLREENVWS